MENGVLHWGHDMSPEENPYETGLEFTIRDADTRKIKRIIVNVK